MNPLMAAITNEMHYNWRDAYLLFALVFLTGLLTLTIPMREGLLQLAYLGYVLVRLVLFSMSIWFVGENRERLLVQRPLSGNAVFLARNAWIVFLLIFPALVFIFTGFLVWLIHPVYEFSDLALGIISIMLFTWVISLFVMFSTDLQQFIMDVLPPIAGGITQTLFGLIIGTGSAILSFNVMIDTKSKVNVGTTLTNPTHYPIMIIISLIMLFFGWVMNRRRTSYISPKKGFLLLWLLDRNSNNP